MSAKISYSQMIRDIMRDADWTQDQVAAKFGVSQSSVNRWLSGAAVPGGSSATEILDLHGVLTQKRIAKGAGAIKRIIAESYDPDDISASPDPDFPEGKAFTLGEWRGEVRGSLPELDLRAGAGEGSVGASVALPGKGTRSSGHMVTNEWLFPDQFLRAEAKASPAHSIVVEIVGDSMSPTYQPGERAIVDLTQTMLSADAVYMISDGESPPQIKRLQRIPFSDPARVKIISDNPLLENFEADLDRVTIYGRVCAAVSRR